MLDDVAALTKVAVGKTAGVLGDDLALNAHQLAGMRAERELPVVYAVAKGSLRNKAMLVPAALSPKNRSSGFMEATGTRGASAGLSRAFFRVGAAIPLSFPLASRRNYGMLTRS